VLYFCNVFYLYLSRVNAPPSSLVFTLVLSDILVQHVLRKTRVLKFGNRVACPFIFVYIVIKDVIGYWCWVLAI